MSARNPAIAQAIAAFMEALRSAPPKLAQSRLLNTADRDLAALLAVADEASRAEILGFLGPAKSRRVSEELQRMSHVRLPPETVERLARHLAAHVTGDRPLGPASRYFRPHTG
ncbi:MAG: hypothetical protein JNG85_12630 [Spirochaetaceae bacterium]|nr:hypothetical protein [Spirochaetaceae bacterium]